MSVLAFVRRPNLTAQRMDHELQPVADPQHGQTEFEYALVRGGSIFVVNRAWAPGEDYPHRRIATNFLKASSAGKNDGKDVLFADAARNELRILRSKVEDND
jgi:hypothetical protein